MTLLLTEEEVGRLLDMDSTLDAVEFVLRDQAEGNATNRARRRVSLPTGGLSYMAAGAPELELMGIKVYSVASTGARFYTMLFDSEGGELLSIIRSDKMGQLRTGAASGVATKHLAREDATTLGIYGAGWQAESQLEAIAAVKDLEKVVVHSRSEESRKEFAEKMGEKLGMEVETTSAPEEPAAQDIVVTMTSSKEPVLKGEWLRPGAHVNAAGLELYLQERDRPRSRPAGELYLRGLPGRVGSRSRRPDAFAGDRGHTSRSGLRVGAGDLRPHPRPSRPRRHHPLRQPGARLRRPGRRPNRLRPGHRARCG